MGRGKKRDGKKNSWGEREASCEERAEIMGREKNAGCEERADLSMCFGKGVQFNFQVIAL